MRFANALLRAALAASCTIATAAQAALITSVDAFVLPVASTGSVGPVGTTPAPNNDNETGASANVIPYSVFFNTPGGVETEFVVSTSGGTTEYRFTQTFVNNSGLPWIGFRFELGFGTGASFTASSAADSLGFDAPTLDPPPTANAFASLLAQSDAFVWSQGVVPSIGALASTFAIDVPDGLPDGRFTLRQTPIVAQARVGEPSTMLLASLAACVLAALSRARRRARPSIA